MASANPATTALLTEHFRYTPLTLLDDIINTVNELIFRAINAIESGFAASSPESLGFTLPPESSYPIEEAALDALLERKQTEIDNGIVQLESLLNAIVDKDFDKFEIYTLRNILAVGHEEDGDLARWVRLEHYRNLALEGSDDKITPEELQLQRRKVLEIAKLNAMLKAEEARNEAILAQLHGLLGQEEHSSEKNISVDGQRQASPFAFLASSQHTSTSSHPLTQNLQYTLSQLPALRELLMQLKSSLAALPSARQARQDDDSVEARRRGYLDSQSRRALKRRGVDVDITGRQVAGRRVGQDEVKGLEAVVQALGGAEGRGDKMDA